MSDLYDVMEKPSEQRRLVRRIYDGAESRLRKLFSIPDDEMIIDFVYDKSESRLTLTTLKDYDKRIDE